MVGVGICRDGVHHGADERVSHGVHLLVGPILDRMGGEHGGHLEPQCAGLGRSGIPERFRGNHYPGKPSPFQIVDVVHTARRAGASISECFDHRVALSGDLVA